MRRDDLTLEEECWVYMSFSVTTVLFVFLNNQNSGHWIDDILSISDRVLPLSDYLGDTRQSYQHHVVVAQIAHSDTIDLAMIDLGAADGQSQAPISGGATYLV